MGVYEDQEQSIEVRSGDTRYTAKSRNKAQNTGLLAVREEDILQRQDTDYHRKHLIQRVGLCVLEKHMSERRCLPHYHARSASQWVYWTGSRRVGEQVQELR